MKKEEIVSSLKEQEQEKYDSASFMRMNEGDVLMEAAKMLLAQQAPSKLDRSRWEGCYVCSHITAKGADATGYSFCPVCGRPLTETAYAKLEEHIDGYYISIESYDKCVDTLKAKLYDMDKEIEALKKREETENEAD